MPTPTDPVVIVSDDPAFSSSLLTSALHLCYKQDRRLYYDEAVTGAAGPRSA